MSNDQFDALILLFYCVLVLTKVKELCRHNLEADYIVSID